MGIHESDAAAAAVAVAPRVSLADIENAIKETHYVTASDAITEIGDRALDTFTLCIVVMHNGFVVVGTSASASPENFNAELGMKFAFEDAVRQLWPHMAFALRQRLHEAANT